MLCLHLLVDLRLLALLSLHLLGHPLLRLGGLDRLGIQALHRLLRRLNLLYMGLERLHLLFERGERPLRALGDVHGNDLLCVSVRYTGALSSWLVAWVLFWLRGSRVIL